MTGERPSVSLIVPFAGAEPAARTLLQRLAVMRRAPGDEVIIVHNGGPAAFAERPEWLTVVTADDHPSSYYARNVGAEHATGEWLLFTDADCEPHADLIERHLDPVPAPDCGAVAGALHDAPNQDGLVPRYTSFRKFLNQEHFASLGAWAFGLTANLLVRRTAFDAVGGFCERIRSTGDAEFCWRLRGAGWSLGYNGWAVVIHHHRETLWGLTRQTARYTAGSSWLRRRHGEPEYMQEFGARAVARGARNAVRALVSLNVDGVRFRLIDAFLLPVRRAGRHLPNVALEPEPSEAPLVLCADRFPADDEQLAEVGLAARDGGCHVEAQGRPLDRVRAVDVRPLDVRYAEDDADLTRWRAALSLVARHPLRAGRWLRARGGRRALPRLVALAPAAERVQRTKARSVRALDPGGRPLAAELAALTGARR